MLLGPNPNTLYPLKDNKQLIFLKNIIKAKNIFVGDYTYFDDRQNDPLKFEENNVLYNYDPDRVKLVIGKFCAIASDTRFLMTGDHKLDAISTLFHILFFLMKKKKRFFLLIIKKRYFGFLLEAMLNLMKIPKKQLNENVWKNLE